jgi:hypothetical protein
LSYDTAVEVPAQAGNAQLSTRLTPHQLQEELQSGKNLAYRPLAEGRIPSTRVGNLYYRISCDAIEHRVRSRRSQDGGGRHARAMHTT